MYKDEVRKSRAGEDKSRGEARRAEKSPVPIQQEEPHRKLGGKGRASRWTKLTTHFKFPLLREARTEGRWERGRSGLYSALEVGE